MMLPMWLLFTFNLLFDITKNFPGKLRSHTKSPTHNKESETGLRTNA